MNSPAGGGIASITNLQTSDPSEARIDIFKRSIASKEAHTPIDLRPSQ